MKKLLLTTGLCCVLLVASNLNSQAQEIPQVPRKPVISLQPLWGPTGYNIAAYYYIPDLEIYYDIPEKKFLYQQNGTWQASKTLPEKFAGYNLYTGYKVVLNRPHPYFNFEAHRVRYARFKGQLNKQTNIKDSTNPKYFVIEGHPRSNDVQVSNQRTEAAVETLAGN